MGRRKKSTAEHAKEVEEIGLVELVGEYHGRDQETTYRCLKHKTTHKSTPKRVLQKRPLECCAQGNGPIQREKAAAEYDKKLSQKNRTLKRIDAYIDSITEIRHLCQIHQKTHSISPNKALNGTRLKCCAEEARQKNAQNRTNRAKSEYDSKLIAKGIRLVRIGEYIKAREPILHVCLKHFSAGRISPNNALRGYGMSCCGVDTRERNAAARFNQASKDFEKKLREKNPTKKLVGEYTGNSVKTSFYCTKHNETHPARPSQILSGQGIHCCRVAKSREIGKLTGPLNGKSIDSVWRVLCGQQMRSGNTWLYLHESPKAGTSKFGISNNSKERSRRGGYGESLIEPRFYPERDQAVLVEQAFKYGYACDIPEELQDWTGNTELTLLSADEFIEVIEELEQALTELGPWRFAEEFCDPKEIERAQKEQRVSSRQKT